MKAASFVMSTPGRFALAEKAGGVTRVLGGRSGRISSLPFPGSRWTDARDLPVLPKQSFREWWASDHAAPSPGTAGAPEPEPEPEPEPRGPAGPPETTGDAR